MAHQPHAAQPRSPADRGRCGQLADHLRQRRRDRARGRADGDRVRRHVRAGGGQGAAGPRQPRPAPGGRGGDGHRRRDLHLHQQPDHHRRAIARMTATVATAATALTPRQIVEELDKYIIGQPEAKRAVAVALRNRWRRQQVPEELRDEILPKNLTLIGPTGVGKTEIARRIAKLVGAPFLKIEASKFTEVGYVGRDVDSIIRDLADVGVAMVKREQRESVKARARTHAEDRLLEVLVPSQNAAASGRGPAGFGAGGPAEPSTREKFRNMLREGKLDERQVEIEVAERGGGIAFEMLPVAGMEQMEGNLREMLGNLMPKRKKRRKMTIAEALQQLEQEEAEKLIDMDEVGRLAIRHVEQNGIVFLDEIDKIAGRNTTGGPDVSREGVQRDLLPIVEGSTVNTKYGPVKTDHILFIAAGAFHVAKPSDMIPELQGRFPIRVELKPLVREDFVRILTEPENALIKQYAELLKTEGLTITFTPAAIEELAAIAADMNARGENIGARRLHTILEKTLEEVAFEAPALDGQTIEVTPAYIRQQLDPILKNEDLSKYIL
ncbi:MAG: ATP-dependent protease ATPase subunit HslU [Candidatus Lambdaproteobacteria bacterium]|nr:ATP-dependent protease ATPase subunit HslU [Candidatus Lambdaproteobacteria bacterium]